jgi:hypothetical protein
MKIKESNNHHQAEPPSPTKTLDQALEALKASAESITASQQKHLALVYALADQAQRDLQMAIANNQASIGARESFVRFLFSEYNLAPTDEIEVESGKITRK